MEWLNYHHLLYFWTVAKEGSVARACEKLRLAQPTISGQLRMLEDALGEKLFERSGRRLVLTEMGRVVYRYADEIFSLGRELMDTVKGRPTGRPARLTVGITDAMPKLIVRRLLEPALQLGEPVRLQCVEDRPEHLLSKLALHEIDVVLADVPLGQGSGIRAYHHLLGECGITFFAAPKLARAHKKAFPQSLDGAPMLLPTDQAVLRRTLEGWFEANEVRPFVVAEIEDSALLKSFGQDGVGVFVAPSVIEDQVIRQYEVEVVGRTDEVRERYYAISVERKLKHPAVVAISESARRDLFP
ncbi:transcriptional activator NhaR [Myxococcota bacterium]|nr:transcriptional activator NhaR [Myxococcota bacterium]